MNFLRSSWFYVLVAVILMPAICLGLYAFRAGEILEHYAGEKRKADEPDPAGLHLLRDNRWDGWTEEISRLVEAVSIERASIEARAASLAEVEKRLAAERMELMALRDDLDARRAQLSELAGEVQASELRNLRELAKTYTTMSPGAASAIFARMDDEMVVKILYNMKSDAVAPIMEEMAKGEAKDIERVALLTSRLRLMREPRKVEIGSTR